MITRKYIKEVFIVLLISISIGLSFNITRNSPLDLFPKKEDLKTLTKKYNENIVSIDELKYYIDESEAIIFDARDRELYDSGHIPFAISLPIRKFNEVFGSIKGVINYKKTIITYCTGFNCKDSSELAKKLYSQGYMNIFVYKGGITDWISLGNRIEKEGE